VIFCPQCFPKFFYLHSDARRCLLSSSEFFRRVEELSISTSHDVRFPISHQNGGNSGIACHFVAFRILLEKLPFLFHFKYVEMTLMVFFGCAFIAFGPALALFSLTVAKDAEQVIVLIAR